MYPGPGSSADGASRFGGSGYAGAGYGTPVYPSGSAASTSKDNLGRWALGLGIAGIFCCGLFAGIPAVIVGTKGRSAADEGLASNRSMSTVGIALGWVGIVIWSLGTVSQVQF